MIDHSGTFETVAVRPHELGTPRRSIAQRDRPRNAVLCPTTPQTPFTKLNEVLGRVCRLLKMMMQIRLAACAVVFLWGLAAPAAALAQTVKSVVGTVSQFKAETAEIEIKPDNGAPVSLKVTSDTMAQRVAPGVTDLKKAESIKITDVALGDRVLATPEAGTSNLRRIVVMPAAEIVKKNEADRMDWVRRGVSGMVTAKSGNEVTFKIRTLSARARR